MNNEKADYIVSLIGKNPMPAFITILEHLENDPCVVLVYTEATTNSIGTKIIAENLKVVLEEKNPKFKIKLEECDKSNPKDINKAIDGIISFIKEDVVENERVGDKAKLVLDYTSGTKSMSAIFYDRIINQKCNDLLATVSYVDDEDERIIKFSKHQNEGVKDIDDILNGKDILIEDITRLHGYKLKDSSTIRNTSDNYIKYMKGNGKVVFLNNSNNEIFVDEVALLNGRLILSFNSIAQKKREKKFELFRIKDWANKLGGNRSKFIYRSNFVDEKGNNYKDILRKDITRAYEYDMEKRLVFIDNEESFEEYIKSNLIAD